LRSEFKGNSATFHGLKWEGAAREGFQEETNEKVETVGLVVNRNIPWLGASPDALVRGKFILEIKCPLIGRKQIVTAISNITLNMRVSAAETAFSDWLLNVVSGVQEGMGEFISIDEDLLTEDVVNSIFGSNIHDLSPEDLAERAILCPKNRDTLLVNNPLPSSQSYQETPPPILGKQDQKYNFFLPPHFFSTSLILKHSLSLSFLSVSTRSLIPNQIKKGTLTLINTKSLHSPNQHGLQELRPALPSSATTVSPALGLLHDNY